jgi:hypothetical protein
MCPYHRDYTYTIDHLKRKEGIPGENLCTYAKGWKSLLR